MPNQPFYPTREGAQLTFFTTLQTKIPSYYDALDISVARQAKITLVLAWLIFVWQNFLPTRRKEGTAATEYRTKIATGTPDPETSAAPPIPADLAPPLGTPFFGMLTWLFEEISRWKSAEGYTEVIGKDLGIIGAEAKSHATPPELAAGDIAENSIELTFNLYEHDGVWIESRVQGDADFAYLGTDTASPYHDTRPVKTPGQAEWREYRACWWDEDTATKQWGPVIRVTVEG